MSVNSLFKFVGQAFLKKCLLLKFIIYKLLRTNNHSLICENLIRYKPCLKVTMQHELLNNHAVPVYIHLFNLGFFMLKES